MPGCSTPRPALGGATGWALRLWASFSGATSATNDLGKFNAAAAQITGTIRNVVTNAQTLASTFHTSLPAALALADQAGINLQQTWIKGGAAMQIAFQQVRNLITGLGAMGAPAGVIGNDMTYLAVQSGLAATKVSQLTQAYQAWLGLVTGGMSAWAQLTTALGSMSNDAAATSARLNGSIGSIAQSTGNLKFSLKGIGQAGAQSWQQFTSAVTSAGQVVTWLQQALASGAISKGLFVNAIKAMTGSMLGFAKTGGPAAVKMLANVASAAGVPITSNLHKLAASLGITGKAAKEQFAKDMKAASLQVGNLSQVAAHLGTVMTSQVSASFSAAILKAVNMQGATARLVGVLHQAHPAVGAVAAALKNYNSKQAEAATLGKLVTQALNHNSTAARDYGSAIHAATMDQSKMSQQTAQVATALNKHQISAKAASIATFMLHHDVSGLSTAESSSAGTRQALNTHLQQQGTLAKTAATNTQNLGRQVQTAGSNAGTASGKMASLATNIGKVGAAASAAQKTVSALATAINSPAVQDGHPDGENLLCGRADRRRCDPRRGGPCGDGHPVRPPRPAAGR